MEAAAVTAEGVAGVVEEARVKRLVLMYIGASTAFMFVAGLLGVLLRESQADLVRIDPGFWYAMMTAHGLGMFVAWAAFGVMGVSFWVLAEVGFPMRPIGLLAAQVAWWTMVIGVLGIVVTTLGMGFGASWVFLYPLPFSSSGEWGDTSAGIFSFAVLLAGVSIIAWCLAIVHTCLGPGLRSPEGTGVLTKLGSALGFGILWPKRFPTERPLPYAVIPLTVIGIDMIIATLPLAALLVVMILQAIDPSITIDDTLAKNLLWFFGHPVVYLLLFPAVAVFYLLVPRFAGKDLVAGRVVAMAWLLGVIVNVIVWAHHIYLDYPSGSIQSALNAPMQPLTFAITIPSAISLYSLSMTIWRSDFQWTPAAKFLAVAMVSWLVAGLQGLVNATIVFDTVVHNTMWIVGHFHNMALLNIGLVLFAAVYAFLPTLTGREWYSESLANSHLWLTVIGGYGMAVPMLVQGLEGAPRRYAVLPSKFDALTQFTVPFVIMMAVGQILFAYNVYMTLRARERQRRVTVLTQLGFTSSLVLSCGVLAGTAFLIDQSGAGEKPKVPSLGAAGGTGAATASKARELFTSNCGSCHTLAAAGTTGKVGPELDSLKPDAARVEAAIKNGGAGSGTMPKDLLLGEEAKDVADWVAENAGK